MQFSADSLLSWLELHKLKEGFLQRFVLPARSLLNGVRSGKETGTTCSTVPRNVNQHD
jgi:hypothetical protein